MSEYCCTMEENYCRICGGPSTADGPLYRPCRCSGSIQFVHSECLVRWFATKHTEICEICHHPVLFQSAYRPKAKQYALTTGVLSLLGLARAGVRRGAAHVATLGLIVAYPYVVGFMSCVLFRGFRRVFMGIYGGEAAEVESHLTRWVAGLVLSYVVLVHFRFRIPGVEELIFAVRVSHESIAASQDVDMPEVFHESPSLLKPPNASPSTFLKAWNSEVAEEEEKMSVRFLCLSAGLVGWFVMLATLLAAIVPSMLGADAFNRMMFRELQLYHRSLLNNLSVKDQCFAGFKGANAWSIQPTWPRLDRDAMCRVTKVDVGSAITHYLQNAANVFGIGSATPLLPVPKGPLVTAEGPLVAAAVLVAGRSTVSPTFTLSVDPTAERPFLKIWPEGPAYWTLMLILGWAGAATCLGSVLLHIGSVPFLVGLIQRQFTGRTLPALVFPVYVIERLISSISLFILGANQLLLPLAAGWAICIPLQGSFVGWQDLAQMLAIGQLYCRVVCYLETQCVGLTSFDGHRWIYSKSHILAALFAHRHVLAGDQLSEIAISEQTRMHSRPYTQSQITSGLITQIIQKNYGSSLAAVTLLHSALIGFCVQAPLRLGLEVTAYWGHAHSHVCQRVLAGLCAISGVALIARTFQRKEGVRFEWMYFIDLHLRIWLATALRRSGYTDGIRLGSMLVFGFDTRALPEALTRPHLGPPQAGKLAALLLGAVAMLLATVSFGLPLVFCMSSSDIAVAAALCMLQVAVTLSWFEGGMCTWLKIAMVYWILEPLLAGLVFEMTLATWYHRTSISSRSVHLAMLYFRGFVVQLLAARLEAAQTMRRVDEWYRMGTQAPTHTNHRVTSAARRKAFLLAKLGAPVMLVKAAGLSLPAEALVATLLLTEVQAIAWIKRAVGAVIQMHRDLQYRKGLMLVNAWQ